MRVLIMGGSGMLGHKLAQVFSGRFDTYATVRQAPAFYAQYRGLDPARLVGHVSVEAIDSVVRALATVRPAVVVNCIGIVKQAAAARDPLASLSVNALFPHRLSQLCREAGARLVHISTDCVFSGRKGNYNESDTPDPEDLYGRTKLLGEVSEDHCLTLRTSMIGHELGASYGLLEWFLNQEGKTIRGYTRAIFTGLTTDALAEILSPMIAAQPSLHGIWHVGSHPISKFELLSLVKEVYERDTRIEPDDAVVCDRSLNAERLRRAIDFVPPTWPQMIEKMHRDTTPYARERRRDAKR